MSNQTPPKVEFNKALMRERARYQISRRDIARHVGVGEGVIQKWERGEAIPSTVQFKRLVTRLGRIAPHPPDWAVAAEQVLDGSADEYRRDAAALISPYIEKLDAQEKPEPQEFHDGLRRVREENEVTQETIGELLGVEQASVSKWEVGGALPVKENLLKLFEVLPELKAGMETGAIRRPKWTQDIDKPVGPLGYKFPRASTVDQALEMALAQSDEEVARPPAQKVRHEQAAYDGARHEIPRFGSPHEHEWTSDGYALPGAFAKRIVCSICGTPKPDSPKTSEVRVVKAGHEHKIRRCPCGGEATVDSNRVAGLAPWVCSKCLRRLWESQLAAAEPAAERSPISELAEAYGQARLGLLRAQAQEKARHAELEAANERLVNAATDTRNARQEEADALALLDLALSESK